MQRTSLVVLLFGIGAIFLAVLAMQAPDEVGAAVVGQCVNCHTMHNSQNNGGVVRGGTGVGWDGTGNLTGGSISATPNNTLLVADCVGCHSSTTDQTIINVGGSNIPIVYNTVPPATPLAGGNFHWVATDDTKGHNVFGIAAADVDLNSAPGRTAGVCSNGTCHNTLAAAPVADNYNRGGCQGCHVFTYHHQDNAVFRFLKGHGANPPITLTNARRDITAFPDYVTGIEDSDWEFTKGPNDHNFYKGVNATYASNGTGLTNQKTVTSFCSGCHGVFHDNMGSSSPWIRHPSDILLPQTGEYGGYNPVTSYSTEAPVGWTDPASPTRAGAVVMCLSCHRAHGSPHADLLRWDYSGMIAGTTGGTAGTGCFTCHTNKDGV